MYEALCSQGVCFVRADSEELSGPWLVRGRVTVTSGAVGHELVTFVARFRRITPVREHAMMSVLQARDYSLVFGFQAEFDSLIVP